MTGFVVDMGIGILTNLVYDIVKYSGAKFSNNRKSKDKELRNLVESYISKNVPEDIRLVLESSTFITYFNSPQFIDVINAYIEQKILCQYSNKNTKIEQYINKAGTVSIQDIVDYISLNILDRYGADMVAYVPDFSCLKKAVLYIMTVSEEITLKNISPENSQLLYIINSRIDSCCENIIEWLAKIQANINGVQEKQLVYKDRDFDEIKDKYHSILKEKNSEAHIYLLDKFPFDKFYVPPILRKTSYDRRELSMFNLFFYDRYEHSLAAWKDIFADDNIVYLTGGAGYGKSLFTKKIINNYKDLNIFHSDEYIVIYGELKSFYPNGSDSALSVIEFLKESIKNSTLMDVSNDFVEYYLNSGRCIVLLDALDEVDKNKRISLHESVIAFFKNQNPNNKICITSRDRGFIPERNVEVFSICPLNEDQIEKYVDKIIALGKFEKADKETFMDQSRILVGKGFLNSFLVLSLLINIYKAERELPENKLELYQKCFEYIANKREKEKTQKEFNWSSIIPIMKDNTFIELSKLGMPNNSNIDKEDIKECLLQVYKKKFACEVDTENAIDEFLKFCSDRTELFVPTSEDKYKFFHRSFFEYFYSLYIYRIIDTQLMLSELLKFDVDSEVFELTIAMLKQKDEEKYQELLDLMFEAVYEEFATESNVFMVFNALILSMQVIDDAYYKKKFLEIIIDKKDQILGHMGTIHNLRIVTNIYQNDLDACAKIAEAYKDKCLIKIFENCDSIFACADKYEQEHGANWFEQLSSVKRKHINERRRYVYINMDADSAFYLNVFVLIHSCRDLLINITDEILMSIYKKISRRNYKKRTARTRDNINRFKSLTNEQQDILVKYFISTDIRILF